MLDPASTVGGGYYVTPLEVQFCATHYALAEGSNANGSSDSFWLFGNTDGRWQILASKGYFVGVAQPPKAVWSCAELKASDIDVDAVRDELGPSVQSSFGTLRFCE